MNTKRFAPAAFLALFVTSVMLCTPHHAGAQVVPPNRNAFDFSVAMFSNAPVYSAGLDFAFPGTPLDFTLAYSVQRVGATTGNLLDLGIRYHFKLPTPGVDLFLSGGLASAGSTTPGFGTVNASGLAIGGGASVHLGRTIDGYAAGSIVSLGGASNSIIDLGLLYQFSPRVGVQIGYLDFAGSGAPYLGINIGFPNVP